MKNANLVGTLLIAFCGLAAVNVPVRAVGISGQGTWENTLQGRDLDGNAATAEAYYDTILDITWLADANVNGLVNWDAANSWAADLSINGIVGWRLPETHPIGESFNYTYSTTGGTDVGSNMIEPPPADYSGMLVSEMAHMFYNTLGNLAFDDPDNPGAYHPGWGLTNTGPFGNLMSGIYWSATEFEPFFEYEAWTFQFAMGDQFGTEKYRSNFTWAVHSGDVGAQIVPIPPAILLFVSGLAGFFTILYKRK